MGEFTAINTALSGLLAQRRALEVIGHNIANSQTEGFTRRRVDLQPMGGTIGTAIWSRTDPVGSGVIAKGITRMREELADLAVRREIGADANAARAADILAKIEQLMPEPSDHGIAAKLSAFWNAWDDAASMPSDIPTRQALLQSAGNLATAFRQISSQLTSMRSNLANSVETALAQVHADSVRVAELNVAIVAASSAGGDAADLQDQRDLIVDRIVRATGATTRAGEHGTVDIFLGGSTLVRLGHAEPIQTRPGGNLDPPLDTMGLTRTDLHWPLDGYQVAGVGGDVGALLSAINEVVPAYLHDLDGVAASLVTSVNALHTTGHGLDTVNDVNLDFFDPTGATAATLALSTDVLGQPSRIALAASTGGPLDSSLAQQIAALTESATGPDAVHRALVSKLATDVNVAASRAEVQSKIADRATADRQAQIGVSLDEELTALIAAQHAFEASSRVLTTVDEMLNTLINRTGVVGR